MQVPRYNKAAFNGKGDRADKSTWPEVMGPLDVILFEGWMLGFKSIGAEAASSIDPALGAIDAKLAAYTAWDATVDSWLIVEVRFVPAVSGDRPVIVALTALIPWWNRWP